MENIYEKLRAKLDDLATGYPATESKVEIRLLQRLFTEEEAELYLHLSPFLDRSLSVWLKKGIYSENAMASGSGIRPFLM